MASRLGCQLVKLPIKYLGIPLGANPNKISTWEPILSRIWNKLAAWRAKTLSRAGRLTLIKGVLNSLPLFYVSIFKAPKGMIKMIVQMQRQFFWQGSGKGKCLPLIKWSIIQKPKAFGGLGVDDLVIKNAALLFKWWWCFLDEGNPLWKCIMCSIHKLNPEEVIPNQQNKGLVGSLWKSISKVASWDDKIHKVITDGWCKRVEEGSSTKF